MDKKIRKKADLAYNAENKADSHEPNERGKNGADIQVRKIWLKFTPAYEKTQNACY